MPTPDDLKTLKVADLRRVLTAAAVSAPARATKADLIARIIDSKDAQDAYHKLYPDANNTNTNPITPSAGPPPPPPPPAAAPAAAIHSPAPPSAELAHSLSPEEVELEKRKARAARFGIPLVVDSPGTKRQKSGPPQAEDEENLKARAQRFGIDVKSSKPAATTPAIDPEEQERRRKRAERFGLKLPDASS